MCCMFARVSAQDIVIQTLANTVVFLCPAVDAGMTTEDSQDERGCHCDITVEDLSAPLKVVIRAVR